MSENDPDTTMSAPPPYDNKAGAYPPPGQYPPPQQYPGQPGQYPPPQQYPGQPGQYPPPQQYPGQPGQYPPPVQNQPGYQPQPNVTVVTAPVVIGGPIRVGRDPTRVKCPSCQADVVTSVQYETGTLTWLLAGGACVFGLWLGCCCMPFCIDACKDAVHTCPNCNYVVGRNTSM